MHLTVGFLVPRTCAWTAELLGLAPPVVGNEECSVILYECLLQLVLGVLVNVFLVVCDLQISRSVSKRRHFRMALK
jgi:hypothetical protein